MLAAARTRLVLRTQEFVVARGCSQLARLAAFLGGLPAGRRYSSAGEPVAEHVSWCTGLAIAARALQAASGEPGSTAIMQATEFVQRLRERLRAAVVGDASALGVREQHAALRLLEEVGRSAGSQAASLGLLELLTSGITALTQTLQLLGDVQSSVLPVSAAEHALALVLPSGAPLPSMTRSPLDAVETAPECGTAFSRHVQATLQNSLCAAIGALSLPGVRGTQPLAAVGEELLGAALRAALRCLLRPPPSLAAEAAVAAVAAAQTCLGLFAAYALQAAAEQFETLQRATALANARDRTRHAGDDQGLRAHVQTHANELRRLPSALQVWAESAMDEVGIDDALTRRAVLRPLDDVSALVSAQVARGAARAEELV
jgi:hypothetical protein